MELIKKKRDDITLKNQNKCRCPVVIIPGSTSEVCLNKLFLQCSLWAGFSGRGGFLQKQNISIYSRQIYSAFRGLI